MKNAESKQQPNEARIVVTAVLLGAVVGSTSAWLYGLIRIFQSIG